jgi:hypothetical protein
MAEFSVVDTAASGFRLIGRKPFSFIVWLLVWLVLGLGPVVLVLAAILPRLTEFMAEAATWRHADHHMVMGKVMAFEVSVWPAIGPWGFWSFLLQTVLFAALCRAMLEPGKSAFAYLRIGMDEMRLLVVQIALVALWIGFCILLSLAVVLLAFVVDQVGHPWGGWIGLIGGLLLFCAPIVVLVRMSMALPATFAEKGIRIFESWKLTRGRFWSLVAMVFVVLIFMLAFAVVAIGVQHLFLAGLALGTGVFGEVRDLVSQIHSGHDVIALLPTLVRTLGPLALVGLILHGLIQATMRVVASAPLISAYAQFSGAQFSGAQFSGRSDSA